MLSYDEMVEREYQARLCEEQSKIEQERYIEEKRRSWIQFWLPFVVTNLISVAALIVAILAYVKQ